MGGVMATKKSKETAGRVSDETALRLAEAGLHAVRAIRELGIRTDTAGMPEATAKIEKEINSLLGARQVRLKRDGLKLYQLIEKQRLRLATSEMGLHQAAILAMKDIIVAQTMGMTPDTAVTMERMRPLLAEMAQEFEAITRTVRSVHGQPTGGDTAKA